MSQDEPDALPPMGFRLTQTAECTKCGRVALVLCGNCIAPGEGQEPQIKRAYTADEVEDAIMRWCGWPGPTIENVRHALKMEACGGVEGGPLPEPPT